MGLAWVARGSSVHTPRLLALTTRFFRLCVHWSQDATGFVPTSPMLQYVPSLSVGVYCVSLTWSVPSRIRVSVARAWRSWSRPSRQLSRRLPSLCARVPNIGTTTLVSSRSGTQKSCFRLSGCQWIPCLYSETVRSSSCRWRQLGCRGGRCRLFSRSWRILLDVLYFSCGGPQLVPAPGGYRVVLSAVGVAHSSRQHYVPRISS